MQQDETVYTSNVTRLRLRGITIKSGTVSTHSLVSVRPHLSVFYCKHLYNAIKKRYLNNEDAEHPHAHDDNNNCDIHVHVDPFEDIDELGCISDKDN